MARREYQKPNVYRKVPSSDESQRRAPGRRPKEALHTDRLGPRATSLPRPIFNNLVCTAISEKLGNS